MCSCQVKCVHHLIAPNLNKTICMMHQLAFLLNFQGNIQHTLFHKVDDVLSFQPTKNQIHRLQQNHFQPMTSLQQMKSKGLMPHS